MEQKKSNLNMFKAKNDRGPKYTDIENNKIDELKQNTIGMVVGH